MNLNPTAFKEGFASVAKKYSIEPEALIKQANAMEEAANWVADKLRLSSKDAVLPVATAGIGIPLLAAAWYHHNKEDQKRKMGVSSDGGIKQAEIEQARSPIPATLMYGMPLASALLGGIGAWQLADYYKNKEEGLPGDNVDNILRMNPAGQIQQAQQKKPAVPGQMA